MITVSIFSIVVLIVVLHTILTHLINWLWRAMDDPELIIIPVIVTILEAVAVFTLLKNFIP